MAENEDKQRTATGSPVPTSSHVLANSVRELEAALAAACERRRGSSAVH